MSRRIPNKQVLIGAGGVLRHPLETIGVSKTKKISPFEDPKKQIEKIQKFSPNTVWAWPSCIRVLAKEILDQGLQGINIQTSSQAETFIEILQGMTSGGFLSCA